MSNLYIFFLYISLLKKNYYGENIVLNEPTLKVKKELHAIQDSPTGQNYWTLSVKLFIIKQQTKSRQLLFDVFGNVF